MSKRDYSLLGPNGRHAVKIGLAAAKWYHTDVPRKTMKQLMERRDGPAIRDQIIYYGSMIVLAGIGIALWPSWWSLPFWIGYSVLYTSGADSRWHEAGHGTAFKTRWMNSVVYHIACFMLFRNPTQWRWSHARHHTDTIIVGRDPEIITMRPPIIYKVFLLYIGLHTWDGFKAMFRHAAKGLNEEEKSFTPESEWPKAQFIARIWLVIVALTVLTALATWSFLPLMVVGLGPAILGSFHFITTGLLQHTGMADNVIDHRLNTRTAYFNPISRFIYWNMNYHVEHHMFPMVPYHALPKLHELIKDDLPAFRVWPTMSSCLTSGSGTSRKHSVAPHWNCSPAPGPDLPNHHPWPFVLKAIRPGMCQTCRVWVMTMKTPRSSVKKGPIMTYPTMTSRETNFSMTN